MTNETQQHQSKGLVSSIEGKCGNVTEKQVIEEKIINKGHWSGGLGRSNSSSSSRQVSGYVYRRLKKEEAVPKEDTYELVNEDLQMLDRFNSCARADREKVSSDLASDIFVHFEKRSTRMTTATKEEVMVEIPAKLATGLAEREMFSFYEYWKGKRES